MSRLFWSRNVYLPCVGTAAGEWVSAWPVALWRAGVATHPAHLVRRCAAAAVAAAAVEAPPAAARRGQVCTRATIGRAGCTVARATKIDYQFRHGGGLF
jgi:hypothetical protein